MKRLAVLIGALALLAALALPRSVYACPA